MTSSPGRILPRSFLPLALSLSACGGAGGSDASTGDDAGSTTGAVTGGSTGPGEAPTSGGATSTGTAAETTADSGVTLTQTAGDGTTVDPGSGATTVDLTTDDAGTSTQDGTTGETGETGDAESGAATTDEGLSGEVRVLQLNLCHSGVAGCFTGDAVMAKAVEVIADVAPTLVTLNEVCREDVPWLAEQTGAIDHRFTPALKADDTPVKCKNGDHYGNGLLAWIAPEWDAPVTGVYAAQSSQTERRVWICMGYAGMVGCTTHLSTAGATALAQCEEFVGGPLATAAAAGPAVMAGDWNLKYNGNPDAQDCVAAGFFRKGDGSVQHMIAADAFGFLETIKIDMDGTTDHPGLEVRLTLP